jgi:hypothetical protein
MHIPGSVLATTRIKRDHSFHSVAYRGAAFRLYIVINVSNLVFDMGCSFVTVATFMVLILLYTYKGGVNHHLDRHAANNLHAGRGDFQRCDDCRIVKHQSDGLLGQVMDSDLSKLLLPIPCRRITSGKTSWVACLSPSQ